MASAPATKRPKLEARTLEARTFQCAVCLDEHPLKREVGEWVLMSCCTEPGGHGPVLCRGECFDGWMKQNQTCPTCRKSWLQELPRGKWLKRESRIRKHFDDHMQHLVRVRERVLGTMEARMLPMCRIVSAIRQFDSQEAAITRRRDVMLARLRLMERGDGSSGGDQEGSSSGNDQEAQEEQEESSGEQRRVVVSRRTSLTSTRISMQVQHDDDDVIFIGRVFVIE
jgi:hypothetical protein